MKISLAWVFDHIKDITLPQLNIEDLLASFNEMSSELDGFEKITFHHDIFALGRVTKVTKEGVECTVPEWKKECSIITQNPCNVNDIIVVAKEQRLYTWATWRHCGLKKEGFFPIVSCPEALMAGEWKRFIAPIDYCVTIDNKALSHRPDMWGHRGIAREIAAIIGATLIPEEQILAQKIIKNYEKTSLANNHNQLVVSIKDPEQCMRIACCSIPSIHNQPPLPWIALRLALMDCKTISTLVDLTNYVMFDIGQPMHAFDASLFESHKLTVEHGKDGEPLTVLDGTTIKLSAADCVITNGYQPVSLAGIIGGHTGEVSGQTTALVLESGKFNPVMIRKSSALHKKRTEASVRFEKNPDPNQNTTAILRYLYLLDKFNIAYEGCGDIISVGLPVQEETVAVSHEKMIKKIGVPILNDAVVKRLTALQFGVVEKQQAHHNEYVVSVPTFRRDVHIPEDVIEEVARFYGYNTMPHRVPLRPMIATDNTHLLKLHALKNHCAFGLHMTEVVNYNLFDEEFLKTIHWKPQHALELVNPVSETWRLLVTTLVPHLFKAININQYEHQEIRCFEWGKVWGLHEDKNVIEQNRCGMIVYNPDKVLDFYDLKAQLCTLFDAIKVPVVWSKPHEALEPWYHPHQTAVLTIDGVIIGYAGKADPSFLKLVAEKGDAFVVEFDGDSIMKYKAPLIMPEQPPKYQRVHLDVSALVPLHVSVAKVEEAIALVDARIIDVYLMDSFEKPEWNNQRSLTFHYVINDKEKTFTKNEIDGIVAQVNTVVTQLGGIIR